MSLPSEAAVSAAAQPAVLIVCGSWHIPYHYQKLVDQLTAAGFKTECPRLPTASNDIPPKYGWDDNRKLLRGALTALADEGHPIIVLMHSSGGYNGSEALEGMSWGERETSGLKGGVVHLIYMAAFVNPVGVQPATLFGDGLPPELKADEERGLLLLVPDPRDAFYHDLPKEVQEECVAKLVVCPLSLWSAQMTYTPYGKGLKEGEKMAGGMGVTYIFCTEDQSIPLEAQRAVAQLLGEGCKKIELKSAHSAMLSRTSEVVDAVKAAWEESKP